MPKKDITERKGEMIPHYLYAQNVKPSARPIHGGPIPNSSPHFPPRECLALVMGARLSNRKSFDVTLLPVAPHLGVKTKASLH